MKINTKQTLKTLEGTPFKIAESKDLTLGFVISEALSISKTSGAMKLYSLTLKMLGDEADVDASDLILIKNEIEITERWVAIIKGQSLLMLEEVKETK